MLPTALVAHSLQDAQAITDCCAQTSKCFGLTVSIKKTELLKQACPGGHTAGGSMTVDGTVLNTMAACNHVTHTLRLKLNSGYPKPDLILVPSNTVDFLKLTSMVNKDHANQNGS